MAEQNEKNGNTITVPQAVPLIGGIKVTGAATILAVMIAGGAYWINNQNELRRIQLDGIRNEIAETRTGLYKHLEGMRQNRYDQYQELRDELSCKIDLAIFLHQFPKGSVDWSALPSRLYTCVPNFKIK